MVDRTHAMKNEQEGLVLDGQFIQWMEREYQKQERAIERWSDVDTDRARRVVAYAGNIQRLLNMVFSFDKPSFTQRIGTVYTLLEDALARNTISPALYRSIKDVLEGKE